MTLSVLVMRWWAIYAVFLGLYMLTGYFTDWNNEDHKRHWVTKLFALVAVLGFWWNAVPVLWSTIR